MPPVPRAQDFLYLLVRSNGHIEQRWVDISSQSMAVHMFVPPQRLKTWDPEGQPPREVLFLHERTKDFGGTMCQGVVTGYGAGLRP